MAGSSHFSILVDPLSEHLSLKYVVCKVISIWYPVISVSYNLSRLISNLLLVSSRILVGFR